MDFDKIAQSLLPLLTSPVQHIAPLAYGWYWLTTHLPINMPLARLME